MTTIALSDKLQIITAAQTQPSEKSVADFALAMGLDPGQVKELFGSSSAAANLIPDAALCSDALEEAQRLLQTPDLAWLFTPDSLAEAPFCARIGSSLLNGSIDRLIVTPDRITIVDFKSNTVVPKSADQVPEGILRQMGAYVAALRQVYPGRSVQPFILWTRSAQLMPLAPDIMSAALDRAAIP